MSVQAVLLPVFVQVFLTFVLLLWTGRVRFAALKAREVKIGDIALGQSAWPDRPAQIARAYHNQLELPILFYVLVVLAMITKKDDLLFVVLEWLFVATRLVHAYIHTGSNAVTRRFTAFLAGFAVLLLMWIIFALRILTGL